MLDEPFTALDADSTQTVKDLTRRVVKDMQIPCIVVTHRVSDRYRYRGPCLRDLPGQKRVGRHSR